MLLDAVMLQRRTGRSAVTLRPVLDTQAKGLPAMSNRDLPSIDYLRQRLRYEADTGKLYWREYPHAPSKWNMRWAGKEAGSKGGSRRYSHIILNYQTLKTHRVAWVLHHGTWPVGQIDHINHVRNDNRIENLRDVSLTENRRNHSRSKANTSGVTGVTYCKRTGKWLGQLQVDRRNVLFSRFDTMQEAIDARKAAEAEYGFHRNHGVEAPKAA